MGQADELLTTIQAIHAAGLEGQRWPDALRAVTRLTRASAASLETYDFDNRSHRMWHGYGNEPEMIEAYLAFHSRDNPYAPRRSPGSRLRKFPQAHVFDVAGLDRDPFYSEYITYTDPRYFAACILDGGVGPETVFTLTRDPSQGHVERADVELFGRLMMHASQALQVAARLEGAEGETRALVRVLDLIAGGAALLAIDGRVLHANAALVAMAASGDGLALNREGLRFASARAREKFGAAMAGALALRDCRLSDAPALFTAARSSGGPAYMLTVRPLFPEEADGAPAGAAAVVFVHDPWAGRLKDRSEPLREVYDLTPAEADFASALMGGTSPIDYARARGVSINTIYTHLRRVKDKTGSHRLSELIRRLNETVGGDIRAD